MRSVPQPMLDALGGSIAVAGVKFNAWYGGQLAAADLPVNQWSMEWDGNDGTVIQGKLSCTVADQSGKLSPWAISDPLGVGGPQMQCQFYTGTSTGGDIMNLSWFVLSKNNPTESWIVSGPDTLWVPSGASVPVEGLDLTLLADDYKFMAPEAPPASTTVMAEITRLMAAVNISVVQGAGVVDAPVPSSVSYSRDRLGAVYDLARTIGWPRMTGDGQLEIFSTVRTAPVWTIRGKDGGALVSVGRTQDRAELFNAAVSTSTVQNQEIIGRALVSSGDLRFDGPLGRKPAFHNAIATTQSGVDQDAKTFLATKNRQRTQALNIVCAPHPGIQVGDWVRAANPTISGKEYPLDGVVTKAKLSGDIKGLKPMELEVRCSATDVAAVAAYIRSNSR